ncbi:hypothetical protein [Butyricicoccus intestinisimiae]|jgi:hypothetical protein|uniref:hypothetical protein n=1 Tax=Butyricicoccus intestinisimiae TaxID=2841509 RepID=UPI003D93F938
MNVSINSAFEIALQTAASLYEGTLAKLLLLLVLGVLCFAGGWIVRWVSALYGAVTGVCLGICLTGVLGSLGVANGGLAWSSAAMLVLGIVLGIIAYRATHLGVFLACGMLGALIGYVPGAFVEQVVDGGLMLVLLACFVLFGVTGVLFRVPAYLIATSLLGIPAGIVLAQLLSIASVPVQIGLGVVLTIAGFAAQTLIPHCMQERLRRAEEAMQDTDPHMQIAEEPEQPDTIDTISDTVAQHIGFSDSIRPPFLFAEKQEQEVQEPEQAEDCTMAIPKPELSEKPDEPEEVDTSTMFLPKADIIQQEQPEPDEQPDQKKSLFADMFDMFQEEADEPEEYEPEPVLAEQRPAQPAEKISLEQLLMDDEGAVNPVKQAEPQERPDEQPEPTEQKPELTPEQEEQRKQRVLTAVFAVVIVAASLVFAAFGVQHVEVLLALCFCMYLGMRYRLAAFGFAVLAVRRLYDAIVLLMQGGHLLEALTDGCICVIFITLTLHMLRTYANSKNQADADETE